MQTMRLLVLILLFYTASCSLWSVIQKARTLFPKKMDDSMREPGIYRVNKWIIDREFFDGEEAIETKSERPFYLKWLKAKRPVRRDRLYLQLKPDGFVKIHNKTRPLVQFQRVKKKPTVDIFRPLDDEGNDMLSELPNSKKNQLKFNDIDGSWWWNGDPNLIVGPSFIRRSNIVHYFLVRLLSLTSRVKRISIETEEGGVVAPDGRRYLSPPVKFRHDAVLTFGKGVDEYGVILQKGSIYGVDKKSRGGSSSGGDGGGGSGVRTRIGRFTMRTNGFRPLISKDYLATQ